MATINGTEIDLMPTKGMKEEAERYREWKSEGESGGTEVAARRGLGCMGWRCWSSVVNGEGG